MHRIRIPYKLLLECRDNDLLEELSVFIGLKYHYLSSHLHSTSNDKLTLLPVCGKTKARKHIRLFKQLGWVEQRSRGISFNSFRTITGGYKYSFVIEPRSLNAKTIKEELLKILVEIKINQYEYKLKAYHYSNNPKNYSELKKAKRMLRRCNIQSEWQDRGVCLSYKGWAAHFGVTESSSYRLLKRLRLRGLLSVKRNSEKTLIPNKLKDYINDGGIYLLGSDGFLLRRLPNSYSLRVI